MDVPYAAVSYPEALPWLEVLCSRPASTASGSMPPSSCSAGFSATSFRHRARKRHVSMCFSELQELPSSSSASLVSATVNGQQMRGCRFTADRAQFVLLLPENLHSCGSHVRTNASAGRFSGALHGGNSRKRRSRKRSDTIRQEDSDEHPSQHFDRGMPYEDVSNDSDSDSQGCADMASGTDDCCNRDSTSNRLASIAAYDSIHGQFWMNDPYYQELEALDFQNGWRSVEDEKVPGFESFGDDHGGNGAASGTQHVNDMDCRPDLQTAAEEVHSTIPEEPFQEVAGAAEDYQEIINTQINSGEYGSTKIEIAESSLDRFGFVRESDINDAKDSCNSGDTGPDKRNLDQKTDGKNYTISVAVTSKDLEVEIASNSEDSDLSRNAGSEADKDQVGTVVDQVERLPQVAEQVVLKMMDQVSDALPEPVVEQVGQVAEQVTQTAEQIVEQVTTHLVEPINTTTSQIANFLSSDEEDEESEDEFEAYRSLDISEFKGRQGLSNFTVKQEDQGLLAVIYNFYVFMLKRSLFEFFLGMLAAPILLSILFTFLYLPQFNGLAFDETVREFMRNSDPNTDAVPEGLQLSSETIFRVFMFSVSLSTGLQPELAPLSPYALVVANLNSLLAQLIFVFLSGAVFARLSQPSLPVKCSTIAIICPPPANRRLRKEVCHKALLTRYVLVGPQPCELVDVKVDLTYYYNTLTRSGTYFRMSQSLKLVRPEIAFLDHGMVVRHIIDETSPLYQRTQGMLEKEDAVFSLSVVGLERSSMQSIFHVQHYCVHDKDVIWDAEFLDMILINKNNQRVVDHSLLSKWRTVIPH